MDINKKCEIHIKVEGKMLRFAKRLRTLRENIEVEGQILTQTQLGEILGVSRMTIYSYETTASNIKLSTVLKIAEVYGISTLDLLD